MINIFKGKSVLVAGGTGMVGVPLTKMLKKLGANIFVESLPMPKWIRNNKNYPLVLSGGDDYQLLLTAPKNNHKKIIKFAADNKIKISCIGLMTKTKKITIIKSDGEPLLYRKKGYEHFA